MDIHQNVIHGFRRHFRLSVMLLVQGELHFAHPKLAAARERLQAQTSQRLRELQLLAGMPLVCPRRSSTSVAQLLARGGAWFFAEAC